MEAAAGDNEPREDKAEPSPIGSLSAGLLPEVVFSYGSMLQHLGDVASRIASQSLDAAAIGEKVIRNIAPSLEAVSVFHESLPQVRLNLDDAYSTHNR